MREIKRKREINKERELERERERDTERERDKEKEREKEIFLLKKSREESSLNILVLKIAGK